MVNTALNSTVKLIGNQSIAGTKTFTGGITMGNEVPLVIGSGDNALKLHGEGANGAYVIEGGNSTHLDVAGTANFLAGATLTTKATPADKDLMNKAMCDAAYAKLNISLTQAQYEGLATKDSRTIYVTTDTAKVFIGSVAVNP